MSIILAQGDYLAKTHRIDEIKIPAQQNACRITLARDNFPKRRGYGKPELIGFTDPDDLTNTIQLLANQDEVARVWVMASRDDGITWQHEGMMGVTGGALGNAIIKGGLANPVIGKAPESSISLSNLDGATLRVFVDALVDIQFKLDIDFSDKPILDRQPTHHSVGFEAANSGSAVSSSTIGSGNITPAGTDRLVIAYSTEITSTGNHPHTLTYAGGSGDGAIFDDQDAGSGQVVRIKADYFLAPAASANAASVTSSGTADTLSCGACAFSNVDQDTPIADLSALLENFDTSPTRDVSNVNSGDIVNDLIFAANDTAISVNQSNTSRWEEEPADASGSSTKTGSGTVTIGWSTAGNGNLMRAWRIVEAVGAVIVIPTGPVR